MPLVKIILIVILVAIAVYLYKRTQTVAKQELEKKTPTTKPSNVRASATTPSDVEEPEASVATQAKADVEHLAKVASETKPEQDKPVEFDVDRFESAKDPEKIDSVSTLDDKSKAPLLEPETLNTENEADVLVEESTPHDTAQSHLLNLPATKGDWASDSFKQLVESANGANDPQSQHDALAGVINHCYKMRKQHDYCQYGAALKLAYLDLFRLVYQQQVANDSAQEIKAPAFMQLSTLLNDTNEFDQAIDVCQQALEYQLTDGTVTGFEGRINRIEKAKTKAG